MTAPSDRPEHVLEIPSSYADQIADALEQEILGGRYRSGAHLQQDEICRRFGVSRTPAREALRKLQALRLVRLVPNRGAMVQLPTLHELGEVYAIRAELEGFAAELAATNRTDATVSELRDAQQRLADAVAAATSADADEMATNERLRTCNDTVHQLVHAASGNRRLCGTIADLQRYFPKDAVRLAIRSPRALRRFYVDEHERVLDEIDAGRPAAARAAMCHHIHQSQSMLLDYLREHGFAD